MNPHNVERTCIVTREKKDKNELIRIGIEDDILKVNSTKGRGVYLLPKVEIFDQALRINAIPRGLKLNRKLSVEEVERLRGEFLDCLNKLSS